MSSNLRALYDRLYIGVEARLLALQETRLGKKLAATVAENPRVNAEYKNTILPYWKQFKVAPPKKFWFRLHCNEARPFRPADAGRELNHRF